MFFSSQIFTQQNMKERVFQENSGFLMNCDSTHIMITQGPPICVSKCAKISTIKD